jgi:MtfA peptidase
MRVMIHSYYSTLITHYSQMQVWDRKQSFIALGGAILIVAIEGIVLYDLRFSPFYLFAGAIAAALFYYFNMRRYFRRKRATKVPFPQEWRSWLERQVPQFAELSDQEKNRFERDIQIFLVENSITGIDTKVDEELRLMVAASAVTLLFGRPEWEYPKLPEILIYPHSFDEEYQFATHPDQRILVGQMVPQNGIVLSRKDLIRAFENPHAAYHVGLHEFAHALDLTDGRAEGIPGYLRVGSEKQWYRLIQNELQRVRERRSVLNPYAGKNTAELFAVAVEHFFQRPEELKSEHPELYQALASFFNQDPAAKNHGGTEAPS